MTKSIDAKQVALAEAPGKVKKKFRKIQERVRREFEYPVELSLWVYGPIEKVRCWHLHIKTRELTQKVLVAIQSELNKFPGDEFTIYPTFETPKHRR